MRAYAYAIRSSRRSSFDIQVHMCTYAACAHCQCNDRAPIALANALVLPGRLFHVDFEFAA